MKNTFMIAKVKSTVKYVLVFSSILILFNGCTVPMTYVGTGLKPGDIETPRAPYKLKITAEYQLNGKHQPNYDDMVLDYMESVMSSVGYAVSTNRNYEGKMHIVVNNKANVATAVSKGLVTGFTWGLIGYKIEDEFEMEVTLTLNGKTTTKTGYTETLVTKAGLASAPADKVKLYGDKVTEKIAQQLILQYLSDNK